MVTSTATSDVVAELRSLGVDRCRRLDADARALQHRRVALPRRAAGRRTPAQCRGGARHRRGLPTHRDAADVARRRHVDRRQRRRHRGRHRLHPSPQPRARHRRRGAYGPGRPRHGARRAAEGRHTPRPALRPGSVDAHPVHGRRDDRQQRVRLASAGVRAYRRQRRRPRRRDDGGGAADRRRRPPGVADPRPARRGGAGRARRDPDRVREVRPPGLGLQPRAPPAGARLRRRDRSWPAPRARSRR